MLWRIIPEMMEMKIKLDEGAFFPERAHSDDAGADLFTPQAVIVPCGGSAVIDTGVHVQLPHGTYGRLESKSGLHIKHDIVCLGGTIDEGYTGSIRVKLYNFGEEDYLFQTGEKVVQLVILPCVKPEFVVVEDLEDTDRGENGFGSTGK